MAVFRYSGFLENGKKISGIIDADSHDLAKERLRKRQMFITDLAQLTEKERKVVLKSDVLLSFTRDLSQLLKAGLPLYESLLTIEEKYQRTKSHAIFLDLCDCLKNGLSLSSALKKYPDSFDEIYISLVHAGEQTGSLHTIYEQLTMLITKAQKLRKQLVSALIYPAFLGSFCLVVVFSLMFFVVPSMKDLFEGRQVHALTQAVLSLSSFLISNSYTLLFSTLFLLTSASLGLRQKVTKIYMQKIFFSISIFRKVALRISFVRFCRTLSILLCGGIPMIKALQLSKKVIKYQALKDVITQAEKHLEEGKPLSTLFKSSPLVPSMVSRMVATAEETGSMPAMLQSIADIYEDELEKDIQQFTTLLQPCLLLLLGVIVGMVLLSILLPLTDVSSFLST
ncbi:MAG: type II secretion system F family protein [Chlamydiae bacterium]|nr:type II secretion system F family protein [Chlamydiota bacterium]